MKLLGRIGAAILLSVCAAGCAAEDEPEPQPDEPASTSTPAPASTSSDVAKAAPDCETPYTIDSTGHKHYKVDCLH